MKTILAQNANIVLCDMQIKGTYLEFSIDIIVIFQIYCQIWIPRPKIL